MKSILTHEVPVIVLGLGAIFGLNADEQGQVSHLLTDLIGVAFTVVPIVVHRLQSKGK